VKHCSDVIVGTPICRRTAYILDRFLVNQQEIQKAYPGCMLVIATDEPDFMAELREQVTHYDIKAEVITYETIKFDYTRSYIWNITCGREALRQYILATGAEYFLSIDADMIFDLSVIDIFKNKSSRFDVVCSAYIMAAFGFYGFGNGCMFFNRKTLNKMTFTYFEFNNGQVIDESEAMDWMLFKCHARVTKGIFVSIDHYISRDKCYSIEPQPMGWFRRLTNNLTIRFLIIQMSIITRHNIARSLQTITHRGTNSFKKRIAQHREIID
jgi:hypothetical protein